MTTVQSEGKSIDTIVLASGSHASPEEGLCAMEAVAWLANERHSDRPECTSPVLAAYVRSINDSMPNEERQKLKPYVLKLLNTKNPELDQKRAEILAWASITEFAPTALHAVGLVDHAESLKNLKFGDWAGAEKAAYAAATSAVAAYSAYGAAVRAAYAAAVRVVAVRAVADAAHAAAYAAYAAPSSNLWDLSLTALDRALEVK